MADETVQQIVSATASSSVNSHPSLIQRRQRRRDNEKDRKERQGSERRDNPDGVNRGVDTVTLTSAGGQGLKDVEPRPVAGLSDSVKKSIDIRI